MKKINYLYKSISCYEDALQIVTGLEAKFGIAKILSQEIKYSPMHSLKKYIAWLSIISFILYLPYL
ncbi:hypothetical protein AT238_01185 [Bartonella henselae]|nr:hypothetical protein AT238_01185 [Bartonella henselae]